MRIMLTIKKSEGLDVEPFDAMAEQLLEDEVTNSIVYYNQMWTIIKRTLISDDDIMCVIAEYISNPWDIMNGGEPDYDCGDDAYVRFWTDCSKAFYDEVNPTISTMINNDHLND